MFKVNSKDTRTTPVYSLGTHLCKLNIRSTKTKTMDTAQSVLNIDFVHIFSYNVAAPKGKALQGRSVNFRRDFEIFKTPTIFKTPSTQQAFTCSKATMKTPEQCVKSVPSYNLLHR